MSKGRLPDTRLSVLKQKGGGGHIARHYAPEARIPPCPRELQGEARAEWKRITTELHKGQMIGLIDRGLLIMTCTAWARFVEAELMIEKAAAAAREKGGADTGLFIFTPNGFPVQSPWLAVSNKAIETYKALCAEFGMSPAARVRVMPQTTQLDLPGLGGGLELVGKASVSELIR